MKHSAIARVTAALAALAVSASCASHRAPAPAGPGAARPIADTRCDELRGASAAALIVADSLLVLGEIEEALARDRELAAELPACGALAARLGDANRLRGRAAEAEEAYADAATLDPCGSGASGLAAVRLPAHAGAEVRLLEIAGEIDALRACGALDVAALSVLWRVQLLLGDHAASERTLGNLARHLSRAESAYGLELVREAGSGSVLVTGSDVETDLALAAARTLGARAPIVVDLDLLQHPRYVIERRAAGLGVDLTDAEILRLAPARRDGRVVTVAEQVLDDVLRAAGHAPVAPGPAGSPDTGALRPDARRVVFSHRTGAPVVYTLAPRLSVVGLVLELDGDPPGVDVAAIRSAFAPLELGTLEAYAPPLGSGASMYWHAEVHRLLSGYVTGALKGSVAALRRGRDDLARPLLAFARAGGRAIGLSAETEARLREIEAYANRGR